MKSDSSNSLALAAQSFFIARRVESSSSRIFAANRSGSGGNRKPVFPSTTVSRYPPSSVARTHFPAAIASTGVIPKSSSTAVVKKRRQRAYKSARRSSGISPSKVTFGGGLRRATYSAPLFPKARPPPKTSRSGGNQRKTSSKN